MVNKFGDRQSTRRGARGPRGLPGPKGDPGGGGIDDMCAWIPDIVLNQFHWNEKCCLQVIDPSKDLQMKDGAYLYWISRSKSKGDADADDANSESKRMLHISDERYALVFEKCVYWIDNLSLIPRFGYTAICVTFMVNGEEDMAIISNFSAWATPPDPFLEISASNKEIRIWGVDTEKLYLPIEHESKKNEWITLFVEWHVNGNGFFMINNNQIHGVFTCVKTDPNVTIGGVSIGAQGNAVNKRHFNGSISSIDIYVNEKRIPDGLRNLLVSSQMIRKPVKEEL